MFRNAIISKLRSLEIGMFKNSKLKSIQIKNIGILKIREFENLRSYVEDFRNWTISKIEKFLRDEEFKKLRNRVICNYLQLTKSSLTVRDLGTSRWLSRSFRQVRRRHDLSRNVFIKEGKQAAESSTRPRYGPRNYVTGPPRILENVGNWRNEVEGGWRKLH